MDVGGGRAGPVQDRRHSDTAVRDRTGRDWDEWFALLDAWGAEGHPHPEIARWLRAEHGLDNWSAQSITVGYEQVRGLRAPGQDRDGLFSVSASRTVAVPVETLFESFADGRQRARWLPDDLRVGTATAPKSLRAQWGDGSSRIAVGFAPAGTGRSRVALAHERLPDAAAATRMKAYWQDRLAELKKLLES